MYNKVNLVIDKLKLVCPIIRHSDSKLSSVSIGPLLDAVSFKVYVLPRKVTQSDDLLCRTQPSQD
jgi:hypothetical protein